MFVGPIGNLLVERLPIGNMLPTGTHYGNMLTFTIPFDMALTHCIILFLVVFFIYIIYCLMGKYTIGFICNFIKILPIKNVFFGEANS